MALTCAQLQKVVAKMDKIWLDNETKADYIPEVGVLEALRKEQTARLEEIKTPDKDKTLRVWWLAQCGLVAEDCEDDPNNCDFTGAEIEEKCQDYALDICSSVTFSIEDMVFRTNEANPEDALVVQMMAAMKVLDEALAQKAAAKLNTFVGVNQYDGGVGQVSGVNTYIPANYWGPDIYGYFGMVKIKNKFSNPFLIHGSNLFQANWQANYDALNPTAKNKYGSMRSYWDLFNIDAINAPDSVSYMIEKGAVAFANKARYPLNNPVTYQFGKRWSIESNALPGVFYDVYYKERCVPDDLIYHDYKIVARAGLFLNPFGCNEDKTGVLKFICGEADQS